jgi:hypothetical protein
MGVYTGKIEARNKNISLYTFLRISLRKINILKKPKLYPTELNEFYEMNVIQMLLNLMSILESAIEMLKKGAKKKKCSEFFYSLICYRAA